MNKKHSWDIKLCCLDCCNGPLQVALFKSNSDGGHNMNLLLANTYVLGRGQQTNKHFNTKNGKSEHYLGHSLTIWVYVYFSHTESCITDHFSREGTNDGLHAIIRMVLAQESFQALPRFIIAYEMWMEDLQRAEPLITD